MNGMEKLIAQFPKHIAEAIEIAKNSPLASLKVKSFNNVVICGMGGSGIGGRIVTQWFSEVSKIPIVVCSDYRLPAFVDNNTLVIGSSYSGNTEETLEAIYTAHECGATIVGVSSGGELSTFCRENNYELITVPGGNPPRSMLAYSLVQLVHILSVAGIVGKDTLDQVEKVRSLINKELITIKTQAKELANLSYSKQVVFYAPVNLEPIAIRGRQQWNENAKQLCSTHVVPEMNHNEVVGWSRKNESHVAVFIHSNFMHERNKFRLDWTKSEVEKCASSVFEIFPKGATAIEESLYIIHLLDWASAFLAEKNGVDIMDIQIIDRLKSALAEE